jgi:ATP-dependent RNA/DNA helicase IGHMBP2
MDLLLRVEESPNLHDDELSLLEQVIGTGHHVKITTNALEVDNDRKNTAKICGIRNVRIVYETGTGILVIKGSLGCKFVPGWFCGGLFVRGVQTENASFDGIDGAEATLTLSKDRGCSIEDAESGFGELAADENLVFNITQFDDFMKVFEYYKEISNALNNNFAYKVQSVANPYWFMPVSAKDFDPLIGDEIEDADGILIGYKVADRDLCQLKESVQDEAREVMDIRFQYDKDITRAIRSKSDELYVSNYQSVDDTNARELRPIELINAYYKSGMMVLTAEVRGESGFEYVNAYDMGQKIKVESIDNSLKLINQGASGAASELLGYLIGDKQIPSYGDEPATGAYKYVKGLNDSQREAFMKAIDGAPVTVIKGPPGTGKTYVINAIVQFVTKELKEKVIISSQTHVAIDNVLDELMSNYDMVIPNRITNRPNKYAGDEIDSTLYKLWASHFAEFNKRSSQKELAKQIAADMAKFQGNPIIKYSENSEPSDFSVIGATTTTSAIAGRKGLEVLKGYDWLIIDEVSKCPITEVLRYLPYVKKIILVGDDFQLAPLLEFQEEDVKGLKCYDEVKFQQLKKVYESSVFADTLAKADISGRLVTLNENYRSVAGVLACYNIFYDNKLIGRREKVNPKKVTFSNASYLNDKDAFFIEVKNGKEMTDSRSPSRFNVEELRAISFFLRDIIAKTDHPEEVSVAAIFPYSAQISKFTRDYRDLINKAKQTFKSFDVDTVDAFQGKQSDIVLVSTVVTDETKGNFLNNFRRINVSMSRAKDKLFIFGNSITLSKIEMSVGGGEKRRYFRDIIDMIRYKIGHVFEYTSEKGIDYATKSQPKIEIK